jgi:hypothetical protein
LKIKKRRGNGNGGDVFDVIRKIYEREEEEKGSSSIFLQ